jgi:flavodoxin
MYEVIYVSKGGNTRKLAEIIAVELGVSAENVKAKDKLTKDSFTLLGSGCYFNGPRRELKKFINSNDFDGRKVALFGTSGGGQGDEVKALEKIVTAKGAKVMGRFYCRGKFLFFGRKHPTTEDLENAKNFAGEMNKA